MRRRSHDPEMGQSLRAGGDTQNRVTSYHETTFNSAILENLPSRQHSEFEDLFECCYINYAFNLHCYFGAHS